MTKRAHRGVTLVEVLITVVIASIAMMALAVPFVAERSFWGVGKRQTEAQRDAQLAMRTIARMGREGATYYLDSPENPMILRFEFDNKPIPKCDKIFVGDSTSGQLTFTDQADFSPENAGIANIE